MMTHGRLAQLAGCPGQSLTILGLTSFCLGW